MIGWGSIKSGARMAFDFGKRLVDTYVGDPEKARELKAQLDAQALQQEAQLIAAEQELEKALVDARAAVVVAEAKGESFIQRNWRPMVMLTFAGLVVAHFLGLTPPTLPQSEVEKLLDIIQLGLGGFVIGRSAEKVTAAWRAGGNGGKGNG